MFMVLIKALEDLLELGIIYCKRKYFLYVKIMAKLQNCHPLKTRTYVDILAFVT
jgi:hypothetical protein